LYNHKKIIAFSFAGGNKYSYNNLFPVDYHVSLLEYPGRGVRVKEELITEIESLVDDLFFIIQEEITSFDNYIIYGHSMGALIGFLVCKKIEIFNLKRPDKLIVSGKKAPIFLRDKLFSNLPNKDFWNEVSKLGGIPEELSNHPELLEYFIPILKADFKCVENYQYDKNAPKLTIPIDVFYGSDEEITKAEAEAWQEETTANVNVTELTGNHFFIFEHKEFFIKYFKGFQLNATI